MNAPHDVSDVYLPRGQSRVRVRVRAEIAKRGRAGDGFLPDGLKPKLVRFWRHKIDEREHIDAAVEVTAAPGTRVPFSRNRLDLSRDHPQDFGGLMLRRSVRDQGLRRLACLALLAAVVAMVLTLQAPTSCRAQSDVVVPCSSCTVGAKERASLTQWICGEHDLAFEGERVHPDSISIRSGVRTYLVRLRIKRLLWGFSPSDEVLTEAPLGSSGPPYGTPVLAWVLRQCGNAGDPCCNYVQIDSSRTMHWDRVSLDWRADKVALSCDSLAASILAAGASPGLTALRSVFALGVAHLDPQSCCPDNGGNWPIKDVQWLLGRCAGQPRKVRFAQNGSRSMVTEFHSDDQLLIACRDSTCEKTVNLGTDWRPYLVKTRLSIGLGIPIDSLATLYKRRGG